MIPAVVIWRNTRCSGSVIDNGIGSANAENASGKRIARVRGTPSSSSEEAGQHKHERDGPQQLRVHCRVDGMQCKCRQDKGKSPGAPIDRLALEASQFLVTEPRDYRRDQQSVRVVPDAQRPAAVRHCAPGRRGSRSSTATRAIRAVRVRVPRCSTTAAGASVSAMLITGSSAREVRRPAGYPKCRQRMACVFESRERLPRLDGHRQCPPRLLTLACLELRHPVVVFRMLRIGTDRDLQRVQRWLHEAVFR